MNALILAAGVGRRLGEASEARPKALLRFGGKSLLQRHIEILAACGIADVTIVVGYGADAIEAEARRVGGQAQLSFFTNPRYREGSIVSLWSGREVLKGGEPVLVMDADVLYDVRLLRRLLSAPCENGFLLDRDVEPGDEPMKLCIRDRHIVDLHKRPTADYEWYGETVGFTRLSASVAAKLADRTDLFVRQGRCTVEYEEAIRDIIVEEPLGTFGYVETAALPWTEIDFQEDVARARDVIFPQLAEA